MLFLLIRFIIEKIFVLNSYLGSPFCHATNTFSTVFSLYNNLLETRFFFYDLPSSVFNSVPSWHFSTWWKMNRARALKNEVQNIMCGQCHFTHHMNIMRNLFQSPLFNTENPTIKWSINTVGIFRIYYWVFRQFSKDEKRSGSHMCKKFEHQSCSSLSEYCQVTRRSFLSIRGFGVCQLPPPW